METTSEGEAAGEIIKEQQHLLGGTATVTVDEKNNMKIKKVMVAVDDSKESAYALKWALDNLFPKQQQQLKQEEESGVLVTLVLVHVYQPYQPFVFPAAPGLRITTTNYATTAMMESARKSQAQNSARVVSRALELCKGRPVITETVVLVGDPKDAICQATETTDCDLLVVGSRGLGTIKRAFLGSVSDYCAHHVQCPVLIVKRRSEGQNQK